MRSRGRFWAPLRACLISMGGRNGVDVGQKRSARVQPQELWRSQLSIPAANVELKIDEKDNTRHLRNE